ncbi:transposable element Tcb2 transposase [Trichonephila clavipes]|nr:transposable element Tcb2 transposase [Trichonephila clavipes]
MTSAREDRSLVRMAQTDRKAFSRQLAAQWSTPTRVALCASSIRRRLLQRGLRARIPLYMIPLTQNHRHLRLHWANVHRSWLADWQQVVFFSPASIRSTMMAELVSGSMPVNGAFRNYRTPQWTNTRSYGLGCHSISWMITIATNCGQFEQHPIHKRSFTALRYSFPARIARGCIPAG